MLHPPSLASSNTSQQLQNLMEYFYKEDFVDWILDLEDFFDYMDVLDERKVKLALFKLS